MTIAVTTATVVRSFEEASKLLAIVGEVKVSPRHLQTLCQEVGGELVAERQRATEAFKERPWMTPPTHASPPVPLAVVMVDGGRVQTRKPDHGPGVHQPAWRETKTAILLRMTHTSFPDDPQPDLPACFEQALGTTPETTPTTPTPPPKPPDSRPQTLVRTGLASLSNSQEFGPMVAAAADGRGFFTAAAKAFVSDGLPYNWSIHGRHFAEFEPILDFVHASEHVHAAAKAVGAGTELGRKWAALCWQGRVQEVLSELEQRQSQLPAPQQPDDEPEHPWCVLGREHGYLSHNQMRMDYPRYRRGGLPITSSPVESWVKQLNQRVKGSEKFWNDDQNAERMLHLRAAYLSDDEAFAQHLQTRPGHPYARPRESVQSSLAA